MGLPSEPLTADSVISEGPSTAAPIPRAPLPHMLTERAPCLATITIISLFHMRALAMVVFESHFWRRRKVSLACLIYCYSIRPSVSAFSFVRGGRLVYMGVLRVGVVVKIERFPDLIALILCSLASTPAAIFACNRRGATVIDIEDIRRRRRRIMLGKQT